jgi:Ser/Thr protein kinase RdoA (MazF antagonist)
VPDGEADLRIAAQISEGFALAPPRRMVWAADGAMGRVWRLDTEAGSFAVKDLLRPEGLETLEIQLGFAAEVSECAWIAGVNVPRVVRTRTGSLMLSLEDPGPGEPARVRVATWIDGRGTVDTSRAAAWLGSTLATIETLADPPSIPPGDPWLASWFSRVPSPGRWGALADEGGRAGAEWVAALTDFLPELTDLSSLVGPAPQDQLTVTHVDFQPKNVLATSDGYALLDWDDVAQASRDRTLARALADWHLHAGVIDVEAVQRTLAAYRAGGGTGELGDLAVFGDFVGGFLNYLFEQLTASLQKSSDRSAAGTAGPVAMAMLSNPIDMATLRRLRDVAQAR